MKGSGSDQAPRRPGVLLVQMIVQLEPAQVMRMSIGVTAQPWLRLAVHDTLRR